MAIEDLLNSQLFATSAGLLAAGNQGADLGTGLLGGLGAGQQMRQMNRRQMLADLQQQITNQQLAAAKRRQESRDRIRDTIGRAATLGNAEGPPTAQGQFTQEVIDPGSGMLGGQLPLEQGLLQIAGESAEPATALAGLLNATKPSSNQLNMQELAMAAAGGDPVKAMELLIQKANAGSMKLDFGSKKQVEAEAGRMKTALQELNTQRMDTAAYADEGSRIFQEILEGSPQLGVAKSLVNFLDSTRSQVSQIFDAEGEVKAAYYDDLSPLMRRNVENSKNEANIMALATRMAKARGGANPSDKDVKFAMTMIGANTQSIPAFVKSLENSIFGQVDLFNRQVETLAPIAGEWAREGELEPLTNSPIKYMISNMDTLGPNSLLYLYNNSDELTDDQLVDLYDAMESKGIAPNE